MGTSPLFPDEEESIYPSAGGLSAYFQNTTEHEENVEEVQQQKLNTQIRAQLIELAHDAIMVRDPTSRIISWNKGAERLYGWTAQEAIGRISHELLQTSFPESREALDAFLASGESWDGELIHTCKDGSQVIVESRQVVTRNQQNQAIAILEINRDITARKQQERENQEQYRTIVRTANEGIWLIDMQACTLYMNDRMANLLGYKVEEVLGRAVPEFTFPEDEPKAQERIGSNLQGNFEQFDFRFRRKDGSVLHVLANTSPVRDGRGEITGALGMFTDITERVQTEQRKDEFISMTSHELKTPVTSLKGFTHVLQRRLARQGDEQGLYYLSRMNAQLDKLIKLISDLLDISRMQTGHLAFQKEAFELGKLIYETIENVQVATTTHQFLIEGRTNACILGDKDRLGQVFINLLANAEKYSPKADKVIVRLSQEQGMAVVSVQDFGIGVDPSYHEKIFERFYQVTVPEERTYPGLGIGLYISKQIIEQHHGQISVQSRKGEGSTFSVALPLYKKESQQESLP